MATSKALSSVFLEKGVYNPVDPAWGAKGDGVTVDTVAIQAMMTAIAAETTPVYIRFPAGYDFVIDALVNCDLPSGSVVDARGAKFTCTHNGLAFDLNPDATAGIPWNTTVDATIGVKYNITWLGGWGINTNATKTASVFIRAYMMRVFRMQSVQIGDTSASGNGFFAGVEFAGKDSYTFSNFFTRGCARHFWVPDAGVVFTASLSANNLLNVRFDDCHKSLDGTGVTCQAGVYFDNVVTNFLETQGSYNGPPSVAGIRFDNNSTIRSQNISFSGTHWEQGAAGVPHVLFVNTGAFTAAQVGFEGVSFDDGCHFESATAGWYGVTLACCTGVNFGAVTFADGSGGGTEQGIYVDDSSRKIRVSEQCVFRSFAAGQAIVLQTATNRPYITIEPEVCYPTELTEGPLVFVRVLTNYAVTAKTTAAEALLDMSAEFTDFSKFLLPPKGYWMNLRVNDSGSAAAGANTCFMKLRKETTAGVHNSNAPLAVDCAGAPNDSIRWMSGYCPADENGDMQVTFNATGAGTLDVLIAVTAVHQ